MERCPALIAWGLHEFCDGSVRQLVRYSERIVNSDKGEFVVAVRNFVADET